MPNEPPTWPVRTCTSFGSTPIASAMLGAHAEDALRADMKREAPAVVSRQRRARLHRVDDQRGC